MTSNLLETIAFPADLRALPKADLAQLARELRAFPLQSVSQTGGHLSSNLGTPAAVRYPRGAGPGVAIDPGLTVLPVGKGVVVREVKRRRNRVAILAFGAPLAAAMEVAETHDATMANMRFVKPLDVELVLRGLKHRWPAIIAQ